MSETVERQLDGIRTVRLPAGSRSLTTDSAPVEPAAYDIRYDIHCLIEYCRECLLRYICVCVCARHGILQLYDTIYIQRLLVLDARYFCYDTILTLGMDVDTYIDISQYVIVICDA